MKSVTQLVGVLFFSLLISVSAAQSYEPPKPRMNKNVLKNFFQLHTDYPTASIKNNEEGTVMISFEINADGKVTDAVILQSVSKSIDSAALRLFSLIVWEPAKNYGLAVEAENEFKIKYSLSKYKSFVKKRGYDKINYPFKPIDFSGEIYTLKHLEQAPEPQMDSDIKNIQEYISQHLEYPDAAAKLSLSGIVKLRFVIETSGLPSNIIVLESVGGGCSEEAIRIVQQLRWVPGIKSGEAVRTCYDISISFAPADEIKNKHIPSQSNSGI